MSRAYWVAVFTGTTWQEFIRAESKVVGFRNRRWSYIQSIERGDYLLCYLTGVCRFIAVLEVLSKPYFSKTRIWKQEDFPCRIDVRLVVTLTPETAVPINSLKDKLSIFQNLRTPGGWSVRFRGSPQKWDAKDGKAVVESIRSANKRPVIRPCDEDLFLWGRLARYSQKYRKTHLRGVRKENAKD